MVKPSIFPGFLSYFHWILDTISNKAITTTHKHNKSGMVRSLKKINMNPMIAMAKIHNVFFNTDISLNGMVKPSYNTVWGSTYHTPNASATG